MGIGNAMALITRVSEAQRQVWLRQAIGGCDRLCLCKRLRGRGRNPLRSWRMAPNIERLRMALCGSLEAGSTRGRRAGTGTSPHGGKRCFAGVGAHGNLCFMTTAAWCRAVSAMRNMSYVSVVKEIGYFSIFQFMEMWIINDIVIFLRYKNHKLLYTLIASLISSYIVVLPLCSTTPLLHKLRTVSMLCDARTMALSLRFSNNSWLHFL